MIAIIDYGRGNLGSVDNAFERLGLEAAVTQDGRVVDAADAVVLPGDGAFHDAMANLDTLALLPALRRALDGRRPFLGICLGYQLLFSESEEFGEGRGLDVIPGVVRRFPPGRKIPHMGWNQVRHGGRLRLFEGIPEDAYFYFVHSYYPVVAGTASTDSTEGGLPQVAGAADAHSGRGVDRLGIAWCEYGIPFAAAIERGSIWATQFHPEKSQRWGLRLLENFAALVRAERSQVPPGAGHPRTDPGSPASLQ